MIVSLMITKSCDGFKEVNLFFGALVARLKIFHISLVALETFFSVSQSLMCVIHAIGLSCLDKYASCDW